MGPLPSTTARSGLDRRPLSSTQVQRLGCAWELMPVPNMWHAPCQKNGSIFLSDLTAERLEVACAKCDRARLLRGRGVDQRVVPDHRWTDLLSELTTTVPGGEAFDA